MTTHVEAMKMSGTDLERGDPGSSKSTRVALDELRTIWVGVGTVRVESGDSEVRKVGGASSSQTVARTFRLALRAGGSEDGGDGQKGRDQELSVEEHRQCQ